MASVAYLAREEEVRKIIGEPVVSGLYLRIPSLLPYSCFWSKMINVTVAGVQEFRLAIATLVILRDRESFLDASSIIDS
jgi:hypothetical protein